MKNVTVGFLLLLVCLSSSCKKNNLPNPVPYVAVNLKLNLNSSAYNILTAPGGGGYVYLKGVGNKGIVVIQNFDGNYYALDRTCPYHINSPCGIITMAYNGTEFVCGTYSGSKLNACCASTYGFDGSVIHGPSTFPLKSYKVTVSGSTLNITN